MCSSGCVKLEVVVLNDMISCSNRVAAVYRRFSYKIYVYISFVNIVELHTCLLKAYFALNH